MSPHASQFAESALDRLKKGFRPATWLQYRRMFAQFIAFLEYENTHVLQVNTIVLLAFMEFCYQSGLSQANISNHLSAIRAMFIVYGLNTKPFQDERVPLYIKSLKINANFKPTMTKLVSIDMLQQIVSLCDQKQFPIVFKALYLFCFFSFMRLSNVLPHSVAQFDLTRHLTRGDIIFGQKICTVIVKWSKTIQDRKETTTISLPILGESNLCPVAALKAMYSILPASKNSPLFVVYRQGVLFPLTDSAARKHLKSISTMLNISPHLTFHAFRRSATTWAFHHGVSLQEIMKHGTWSSEAVWRYIKSVPSSSSQVARTFQSHLFL